LGPSFLTLFAKQWRCRTHFAEFLGSQRQQTLERCGILFSGIHPVLGGAIIEHHRHPIVNRGDDRIRCASYDRESQRSSVRLGIPLFIEAGEEYQAAFRRMDPEGLPSLLRSGPFVESIGRYDATAPFEGFAKARELIEALSLGVDRLCGVLGVSRPAIHQAPPCALPRCAVRNATVTIECSSVGAIFQRGR
jgi:hypothetical protein